jgi:hypothetical protein
MTNNGFKFVLRGHEMAVFGQWWQTASAMSATPVLTVLTGTIIAIGVFVLCPSKNTGLTQNKVWIIVDSLRPT